MMQEVEGCGKLSERGELVGVLTKDDTIKTIPDRQVYQ